MVSLVKTGLNNGSVLQDEEGNSLPIAALDVIINEVLEQVSNRRRYQ